jgi:hypothetical protein
MAGLRWLSVPDVLLVADQAWLRGLEQLRVLVLCQQGKDWFGKLMPAVVEGLATCSMQVLPPRLLLLGFRRMPFEHDVPRQVWRRLQQRLSSRGCEVVVGVDLHEVFDPVKQLAGVPVALQQALA